MIRFRLSHGSHKSRPYGLLLCAGHHAAAGRPTALTRACLSAVGPDEPRRAQAVAGHRVTEGAVQTAAGIATGRAVVPLWATLVTPGSDETCDDQVRETKRRIS